MLGMVAPVHIVSRNAYQDAQGMGLGVIEFEPDGESGRGDTGIVAVDC